MGAGASKTTKTSKQIDKQLVREKIDVQTTIKLLLLGAAGCGKSTILKQMIILHTEGFNEIELHERKIIILNSLFKYILELVDAMHTSNMEFAAKNNKQKVRKILDLRDQTVSHLSEDMVWNLKSIWNDASIRHCYSQRNRFQIDDSAEYFLGSLDRLAALDYKPTNQDMLYSRVSTQGVMEIEFKTRDATFKVFDVGGQRSERRKWIHCFDLVQAIIFIAALSDYDILLEEDGHTNRMVESVHLFEAVYLSQWFRMQSFILFLNKSDLFAQKISRSMLADHFGDFPGPSTYENALKFIRDLFLHFTAASGASSGRHVYDHVTCATDTDQVEQVLDSVLNIVIAKNLGSSGFG